MTIAHTYRVPGISCNHCKAAIEAAVGEVAGVSSVNVDVAAKSVAVVSADTVAAGDLVAAIDEAGYDIA